MVEKKKVREITLKTSGGTFTSLFKKFEGNRQDYDFSDVYALRKLLSAERARMLDVIKKKKPESLYRLAKILGRDFKSVRDDIKLLERFGFLELVAEKKGKRNLHRPMLITESVHIIIKL